MGWNGPGPYLIENNYLEAAGENVMFGGTDPSIPNLVPSNITIRRNLISRPLAWMSQVVDGEEPDRVQERRRTCWSRATRSRTTGRRASRATPSSSRRATRAAARPGRWCENITMRSNVIRHVAAVFNISGWDDIHTRAADREHHHREQPGLRREHGVRHSRTSRQRLVCGDRQRAEERHASSTTPSTTTAAT